MYVRLGFSVAINVDPDVLLVDEVLAVGDEAFQRKCNEKFAELTNAGKTIVLVSHGMSSVHNLCDQVAWLEHGRLKMLDDARKVVDEYSGNVQIDRVVDEESGNSRWGSGEGRIEKVEILDSRGDSVTRVLSGDQVTMRFHYSMSEPLERPVLGMAIHTINGIHVTGPNIRQADMVPEKLDGTGYFDLVFDRLLLVPGTYDLTVNLSDYHLLKSYDYRHKVLRFDVERGSLREEYGVVSLGGHWHLTEDNSDR
jgi:ABC-2 type transport system ATP-binding protein